MLQFSCATVNPTVADFLPVFDIPVVTLLFLQILLLLTSRPTSLLLLAVPAVANIPDVANVSMPSSAN
jgi:hypothetical protein